MSKTAQEAPMTKGTASKTNKEGRGGSITPKKVGGTKAKTLNIKTDKK